MAKEISSKVENIRAWLDNKGWSQNPFTFSINPSLFVGYKKQTETLLTMLEEGHKLCIILGPTGSGKTTILKWLMKEEQKYDYLYLPKPPSKPEDFVDIFGERFKISWISRFFGTQNIKTLYDIPALLDKKQEKKLIILLDEAQEADIEVLEWLRVLSDQTDKLAIILTGLPVLEDVLKDKLESLRKRVAARMELVSLTKEDTRELIKKRIIDVGGKGDEFPIEVIDYVYQNTAGFPREVIRVCNDLVNKAIETNKPIDSTLFEKEITQKTEKEEEPTLELAVTGMQRQILEMMSTQPLSPGQIADNLDLTKYKTRQHAVRSINNILKDLLARNFVERTKQDKTYIYNLAPRLKTMFVKA